MLLNDIMSQLKKVIDRLDFDRYFGWFMHKFELIDKATKLNKKRDNYLHTIRPQKGDIYLIEFGQNIGSELSNTHMGIIIQSSLKNSVSNTIIVIPISSSPKLYDTHEKIIASDLKIGKLDKLPSKAKAEQITCIDKSRLVHKIGALNSNFMQRLEKRILKNLDIM